MIQLP